MGSPTVGASLPDSGCGCTTLWGIRGSRSRILRSATVCPSALSAAVVGRQIVVFAGCGRFRITLPLMTLTIQENLRQTAEHHARIHVHVCRLPFCLFETRQVMFVYPVFGVKSGFYMYFFNGGLILEGRLG